MKQSISQAKKLCHFIVVTMHAGKEYTRDPNKSQKQFAHTAIDAGADMVIGAHPHWIQTIERYCPDTPDDGPCVNPHYIFYSLGNFIFDQAWSRETKEGMMLAITFSGIPSV
jgi:poly-gamma-glutamate synthesis protein (capsule biosynthesis protein)